ncbi:leucine-rich repeat-containing protein 59-like isoform X3 [Salvelinus fontinalis]|uniref:leucine-rich repeat-containing protein 59-like isoform X3 n=1 Tax=Salvelinus fontinalis TaxID=8038 RepID=UPI0024852FCC|nr:leucine-rich repeat-containing protein 59-like isoform X3 [Salvelinus fontinalis]
MSKNKVLNLKDKIDGNEMDLSLCNLTEIPVKELAAFPKVTVLDLSCNNITSLPLEFCSLSHLVKVDLSKNQLTVLPDDLGRLGNLQHLDLYNNKLTILPVSFSQLKNLKWLDLKDNPLEINLAKAAGDCLDEKQCKQCAARVLQHMRILQEEVDKERERRLLKNKGFHFFSPDLINVHILNVRLRLHLLCHFPTLLRMARCQAQKPNICPDGHQFSTLVLFSLLRALVCVFPNKDQLRTEAADVGGIWRMMEATGERASDPQSPFHQVADEICWHDCHIASPSQSPCLEVYFVRLPRTLPLSRPRW